MSCKLFAMVVIVTVFASCGVFHKTKHKERHSLEEIVNRDCVIIDKESSKGEIKSKEVDKGTTVTERTTTTKTTRGGGTSIVVIKKGDLKNGANYLKDSAGNDVKAVLDTLKGTLSLSLNITPEITEATTKETISDYRDIAKDREEKQESQQKKQIAVAVDSVRRESDSVNDSDSKPSVLGILSNYIGWAIGIVIVVVAVAWWFFGIKRKQ